MNKEGKGTALKIIIAVLATIIVVVVIIVVLALWSTSVDDEIEKINVVESDYLKSYDALSIEYEAAAPEQIRGNAGLLRAIEASNRAKITLSKVTDNATEIKQLVSQAKTDFSGNKLEWLNKMQECYDKRLLQLNGYKELLTNEDKYFAYNNYTIQYDQTTSEFNTLLAVYLIDARNNDKESALKTLNDLKIKFTMMRTQLEGMNNAINLPAVAKLLEWTDKYKQVLDLNVKAWTTTGLEQQITDNEAGKLGIEAAKLKAEGEGKWSGDFDNWWTINIVNKRDEASRNALAGNQACTDAYSLYTTIYGNIVKEAN